jgi:uncharacterized protein
MTAWAVSSDRRVLLDTSAYYAFVDLDDRHHEDASIIMERLASERWRLFTTNLLVAETHALLLKRLGREIALRFLMGLEAGSTTVVRVTPSDEAQAVQLIQRYTDKNFTLTDACSFIVAGRLRINLAFSFDRDFRQYGLPVLQA